MSVIVNAIKDIDGTKQWVFITLTVDGDSCRCTTVQPWNTSGPVLSGDDLTAFCNGREDTYKVEILKSMYPNARYQDAEGDTDLEKFTAWIESGHTNTTYCSIAEHITEQDCLVNGGKWTPERIITKVPFKDSHDYTGTLRTRKLEQLNQDLQTYLYTKYDIGTQISFQAIETRADTPEAVKTALGTLWTWIGSVMAFYYAKKVLVRDEDDWQTVTWDFSTFDATDPEISLEALMG